MPTGNEATRFKPGQVANPGGRPKLSTEDKSLLKKCNSRAIELMHRILHDETAFGKGGWIRPQDQMKYLEMAMNRVQGRPDVLQVEHQHGGSVSVSANRLSLPHDLADRLPERNARRSVFNGRSTETVEAEVADPGGISED